MDTREFIGNLKVKVVSGRNLAVRDMVTSDPYVVLILGQQVNAAQTLLGKFLEHPVLGI